MEELFKKIVCGLHTFLTIVIRSVYSKITMKKEIIDSPKRSFALPIILGVLAIFLLAAAFFGSFAYSFVKTRIINKAATTGTGALQQLEGMLGGVPGGSTITSKAEGIATCKKSGVDYCWPLVALSFNDMSVCKQAPDPKACETEAKEFKEDFEGGTGGAGGTVPDAETTPASDERPEDKELKACKTGTVFQSATEKMAITGKETLTIEGTRFEICCWTLTSDAELASGKFCMVTDQPNSMILYRNVDEKNVLESATLIKDGKECTYMYEDGQLVNKQCYQ